MEYKPEKQSRDLFVSKLNYDRDREEDRLFEFEGDPNHILRIDKFNIINAQLGQELEPAEAIERVRRLFSELKDKYSINVPVSFEIVESEEEKLLYTITDKINGMRIEEVNFESESKIELIKIFEDLFLSLTIYFIDKFKSGDLVLWDIAKSSAYVYGKKEGDTMSQLYLVDTDTKIQSGKYSMGDYTDILTTIKELEIKAGIKFSIVRERLGNFIGEITQGEIPQDAYWVPKIQQFLTE
ncbi:MAG: hypothetical protein HQ402_02315 [Parcubacteria group bacterium]|nr:hypothetical protein [Parcubacteria group bacterium]